MLGINGHIKLLLTWKGEGCGTHTQRSYIVLCPPKTYKVLLPLDSMILVQWTDQPSPMYKLCLLMGSAWAWGCPHAMCKRSRPSLFLQSLAFHLVLWGYTCCYCCMPSSPVLLYGCFLVSTVFCTSSPTSFNILNEHSICRDGADTPIKP